MSETPELRAPCPGCGKSLRFPPDTKPGKKFKCPKCGSRVTVPEAGGRRGGKNVFLPTCPVCAKGAVVAQPGDDEELYTCENCETRISETMLGYLFVKIDKNFFPDADRVKTHLFTKSQLNALSEEAARTGEPSLRIPATNAPAKPPPPAKPAPTKPEQAKPPETEEASAEDEDGLSAEELLRETESPVEPESEGELWWEVDEEALSKQNGDKPLLKPKSPQSEQKKSDSLSVDDLLDELN